MVFSLFLNQCSLRNQRCLGTGFTTKTLPPIPVSTATKLGKNVASGGIRRTPIGFISCDLDYYSSTLSSFDIFNNDNKYYLPRIFCYFDDVLGDEVSMYGEHSGELLAIKEFNEANKNKKIHLNRNLICHPKQHWRYQIYYYHNFLHPRYNDYLEQDFGQIDLT